MYRKTLHIPSFIEEEHMKSLMILMELLGVNAKEISSTPSGGKYYDLEIPSFDVLRVLISMNTTDYLILID